MRTLIYVILSALVASCVGGTTTADESSVASDTDTIVVKDLSDFKEIDALAADSALLPLTARQVDSIVFRLTHHYTKNSNFLVKADSLTLLPREGDRVQDTCRVFCGDLIAVAEIKMLPTDTIDIMWVKVAHDQYTMGWIPEHELLRGATPDDMISQILSVMSSSRAVWMTAFIVAGIVALLMRKRKMHRLQLLQFSAMASPYPFLFIALVGIMASLYASVQNFVPEFWQEYYFNPTLNPLVLPSVMAALVVSMWLVIIVFVAVLDEVYHHFFFIEGLTYCIELLSVAMVVYLVISWTTLIYVGYLLLAALLIALACLCVKAVTNAKSATAE